MKIVDVDAFKASFFNKYFQENPIGFLDVGARGGSHSLVEPLHTHVSFLGFEPDVEECDALNNNNALKKYWHDFEVLPYALSSTHAPRTLNIISAATNTSLLKPNPVFVERYNMQQKWSIIRSLELTTVPMDHVIYDLKRGFEHSGEILKVDTQGTELEILEGAKKLLTERTLCVVAEVEFFQIYQGQKLFSDMELHLRSLGFSFYGFLTLHTRSKKTLNKKTHLGRERLFYADAIFFKDPFASNVVLNQREYAVLLFAAILTGYYDFALEVAMAPQWNLAASELNHVKNLIEALSYVDPDYTNENINCLIKKMNEDRDNTNIYLGKFIDEMNFPDFEDCQNKEMS